MRKMPPPTLTPGPYVSEGIRISLKQLRSRHMLEVPNRRFVGLAADDGAVGARDGLAQRCRLFLIGLEGGTENIELHLSNKAGLVHEAPQLLAHIEWLLHGRDAHVDINRALLDGLGDLPGHAAANGADVDFRNHGSAGALVAILPFVRDRPILDRLDHLGHAADGARVLFDRHRSLDIGRINRQIIAEDGDLEERLPRLDTDNAEIGALRDQRVVGNAAVRDRVTRARLLGEIFRRLELVRRVRARSRRPPP